MHYFCLLLSLLLHHWTLHLWLWTHICCTRCCTGTEQSRLWEKFLQTKWKTKDHNGYRQNWLWRKDGENYNHPNKQWAQQATSLAVLPDVWAWAWWGKKPELSYQNFKKNNEVILCVFMRAPPKHEWQHKDTLKVQVENSEGELPYWTNWRLKTAFFGSNFS